MTVQGQNVNHQGHNITLSIFIKRHNLVTNGQINF